MRRLRNDTAIKVIHDSATAIDPVAKTVALKSGAKLPYDRLVLAPGIAFKFGAIEGYDEAATRDHAARLERRATDRAAATATRKHGGRRRFRDRRPAKSVPLPARSLRARVPGRLLFQAVQAAGEDPDPRCERQFLRAGSVPGRLDPPLSGNDRVAAGPIHRRRSSRSTSRIGRSRLRGETFKAAVVNFIPPQMAGELAQQAGLADQSGWCPVEPTTFESKLQPGIHVVGDATSAGDMPKSAFFANSQAKVCAFAIAAALTGSERSAPHLFNTCFTLLAADDAVSDAIAFEPDGGTIKISEIFISQVGEDAETRRQVVQAANGWYAAFTHDVFG